MELTRRQSELIDLVSRGMTTREIAARLGVTERAVTARLTRLYERYGVANRAGLIARILGARIGAPAGDEYAPYRAAPFMVAVTTGPEHRFAFVNDIAARVAGRPAGAIVGRTLREAYPEVQPEFEAALDEVYRTGRPLGLAAAPARFPQEGGGVRETLLNLIFQRFERDGTAAGILHIGTEITH